MPLIKPAVILIWLILFWAPGVVLAQSQISLSVVPGLDTIRPNAVPVTLTVAVEDGNGLPAANGWVDVRLMAPDRSRFLTTDFPVVEGSRLLEVRLPLEKGRASWQYVFPIRGLYSVFLEFADEEGSSVKTRVDVHVRESGWKYFYLGLFSAVLFLTGLIAGRVFTGRAHGIERFGLFVLTTVAAIFSFSTWVGIVNGRILDSPTRHAALEVAPAIVGKPSEIRWSLNSPSGGDSQPARLTLTVVHREKGKMVFGIDRIPVSGEFFVAFHFTDGSEYRIESVAELETGELVKNEQIVAVTPVEPPARSTVPAIMLALFVVGVGLVVGRWSRTRAGVDYQ